MNLQKKPYNKCCFQVPDKVDVDTRYLTYCDDCIMRAKRDIKPICVDCGVSMEMSIDRFMRYGNYCNKCNSMAEYRVKMKKKARLNQLNK